MYLKKAASKAKTVICAKSMQKHFTLRVKF